MKDLKEICEKHNLPFGVANTALCETRFFPRTDRLIVDKSTKYRLSDVNNTVNKMKKFIAEVNKKNGTNYVFNA